MREQVTIIETRQLKDCVNQLSDLLRLPDPKGIETGCSRRASGEACAHDGEFKVHLYLGNKGFSELESSILRFVQFGHVFGVMLVDVIA